MDDLNQHSEYLLHRAWEGRTYNNNTIIIIATENPTLRELKVWCLANNLRKK